MSHTSWYRCDRSAPWRSPDSVATLGALIAQIEALLAAGLLAAEDVLEVEAKPLFSDLYDETTNLLVEAKGSVHRAAIRMAIGQLADYSRFIGGRPKLGILLPAEPREDLKALCRSRRIRLIWPHGDGYRGLQAERS